MWALLMQLLGVLPGTESFRPYLLATQFEALHGFLRVPADWAPVIRALWSGCSTSRSRSSLPTSSSSGETSRRNSSEHLNPPTERLIEATPTDASFARFARDRAEPTPSEVGSAQSACGELCSATR